MCSQLVQHIPSEAGAALDSDQRRVAEHAKWRRRSGYYHDSLIRLFQLNVPSGSRVLQVGCGDGELLDRLQPSHGVGIDSDEALVRHAQAAHPHLQFHAMDEHVLSLDGTFDYIVLSNVLGVVDDIQLVLQQLRSLCHNGTRILIAQYNYLWEPALRVAQRMRLRRDCAVQNWLSLSDLDNILDVCDFRVVRTQRRMLLPKYVPIVSHLLNRYAAMLPGIDRLSLVNFVVAAPNPQASDPQQVTTSVIIPTKDERGNIEDAVRRTPDMGRHTELIFVDGNSTDGTQQEIERIKQAYPGRDIKFMNQPGKGKGDAVRAGFDAASGDVLMILDSDLTTPPEDMPKFFDALVAGRGELINGSRLVYPREDESMRFLNLIANKLFAMLLCWLLEQRLKDTLCGTKVLYKKDYLRIADNRRFFGDFDPFGDFDLLFGAAKLNMKIVDIPIRYRSRSYGEIKIHRFTHGWMLLKMCCFAFRKIKS